MSFELFYNLKDGPWEILDGNQKRRIVHMDNITVIFFQAPKGLITPIDHYHSNEQVTYLIHGKIKIVIGNKEKIIKEGEVYMVHSNEKHHIEVLENCLLLDFFSPKREDLKATK